MSLYSRLDRIAADVEKLNRQVNSVANSPQSQRTSVEGGSIDFNDADGNLKAIVGMQDDGGYTTNVVSGPTPPTPTGFTVEVDYGKLVVHWDGSFGDALVAPTDWARAEVYAQEGQFVTPSRELARGSMVAASGGEVTVGVLKGQWTVCMAGWSQAGIMSPMSAPVTVEVPGYGDLVQETLDEAQKLIDEAKAALEAGQADLAEKITDAEAALAGLQSTLDNLDSTTLPALRSDLDAAEGRLSSAEGQITDAFGEIQDARSDAAADATSKANAAEQNAKSAAQQYDTALKGQIDSTINQAKADLTSDINAVRTSANGKNTVTWSTSSPPTSYSGAVNDTWFVMSGAGSGATVQSQWRWNGNVWVSTKLSQAVLAQIDIGTGTFGEMDGARLKAGSIYADRIVSGLSQNMVPDPGFANQAISNARLSAANFYEMTAGISDGILWFETPPTATLDANISLASTGDLHGWSAYPGMKVISKIQAKTSNVGYFRLNIRYKNRDGSTGYRTMSPVGHTASGVWAEYVSSFTLPQEAVGYSIVIQVQANSRGRLEFRSPFSASAVGGTVIEDGAITTDKVAANLLEVGNLKAGVAAIAEAVVQKIAASTASIQQADVKNLFVTGTSSLSDVVAERIAAETAEFIQLEVGNLVAGTGSMDSLTVQKLFSDVVVASMAVADEFIGENAILTGAVTAPKITASEELWAKIAQFVKIRAEHIEADAIDGMVITGPNIRTAANGARVQMDPNGVRVFNADNDVRTHLSPDGSTFKGEVEAETLVVNDGAEFKGNNTLAQGAKLTLAAGVTDPTAPPVVQPYWEGVEFTPPSLLNGQLVGLAFDGTNYWTAAGTWYEVSQPSNQVFRINSTTGSVTGFAFPESGTSERFGVTCIGSELFWLYRNGYKAYVVVTNLSMTKLRGWEYPNLGYSATNPLTYKPGVGNDGTNVVIAHANDDGRLIIRTFNKTTGAQIGADISDSNDNTSSDITGVYVGNADWGRKLVTVAKKSTGRLPSFNATTGVYDGAATQFDAAAPSSTGVVYAGGKFRTLDPSGVIHEYADANTGDNSGDWWAGYGWWTDVDNDGLAETSDYQSRMSPPTQFTWPSRAGIKIMGQPMPTGAGFLIPWLAKKTTGPVRTDFHGTAWDYDTGKPIARISALPPNWTNTISPPAVNTFPEGDSSVLESASGTFQVKGDGSGHWGPLTMGRDGIMSGLIVSGSASAYVDTANTSKKFTVQLPPGRFTKPPVVWVQVSTAIPNLAFAGVVKEEIRTTSFDFWFNRHNTTSTSVTWFAMDAE